MGKIVLERMAFFAYHGLYESEAKNGNQFEVDVELDTELEAAGRADDVSLSLDYSEVFNLVKAQMEVRHGSLEAITVVILDELKTRYPQVKAATVRMSKLNPPFSGQCARATVQMGWKR